MIGRGTALRALAVAVALLGAGGCGDDDGARDGAGPGFDAGPGSRSVPERPALPRPPAGGLPDELRPPR